MAWLAYFTSNMITLVSSMNQQEEHARAKIGRVAFFCRNAGISPDLNQRVQAFIIPRAFLFYCTSPLDYLVSRLASPSLVLALY